MLRHFELLLILSGISFPLLFRHSVDIAVEGCRLASGDESSVAGLLLWNDVPPPNDVDVVTML